MNDKYKELLDQYDVNILSTFRSRGTFQCETDQGLALLKEYRYSLRKLALEYEWKEQLISCGFSSIDQYFVTKENSLITHDRYHTPYILKHYFGGRECDCRNLTDVYAACKNLACLHKVSSTLPTPPVTYLYKEAMEQAFTRRTRELRTVRKFISGVHRKSPFELLYLKYYSCFYEEATCALSALEQLDHSRKEVSCGMTHGAYHHHNVLILPEGHVATVNFESICHQPYLMDFYLFMRKTLEKNYYNPRYFEMGIEGYTSLLPLDKTDYNFLYLLFLYPEKFWKLSNHYYNHRKSWISPKMEEKLKKVLEQNEKRQAFLQHLPHY